ncbi:uncharacterized protein LOC123037311 [Drosophila rhopaloa]|uniref:RNA-directed DNA polymerase n=1 Tax=Drosophila rhopaloa TaxID=1041015 RepID=A0ABM5J3B5_DRORH|nr:uncharacterized protein LOC123037311 [Drosophila rhopaloa]
MSENEEYDTDSVLSDHAERIASPPFDPATTPPPPPLSCDRDTDSQSTILRDPSYECKVSSGSNGQPRQEEEPPARDDEPDTRGLTTARLARLSVAGSPAVGYSTACYLVTAWLESVATPAFAEGFEERCVQESRAWVPHPAPSTDDSSVGEDDRFATGGPPVPLQCSLAEANDAWASYVKAASHPAIEDFTNEAQRVSIYLTGRAEDMRKALVEYYNKTENNPELKELWSEQEAWRRDSSQGRKTFPKAQRPSEPDYAKVAKQVREWSFRFEGTEKPLEFLEQMEWSASTYGLDFNMVPRAMPELLQGRALKWFISNNQHWKTWGDFIESFQTFFLPRGYLAKLEDQVKARKQGFREPFKDYMVDMQTMIRPLGFSPGKVLEVIRENSTPDLRISLRTYKIDDLEALMILATEYEELEKEREMFSQKNKFSRTKTTVPSQAADQYSMETSKHYPETTKRDSRKHNQPTGGVSQMWRTRALDKRLPKPAYAILLDMRKGECEMHGMLPESGKWPAIPAAERRAGVARGYLSNLTGRLIEEEQQLSAAVTIGGNSYKATIDTGATASFISEELADNLAALGKITRTRRQVRLADGRCSGISAQLEVEIAFGNKRLTMSLLILPGVVDALVLCWNFLTQVGAEINCTGHEIRIPARNRHNGWLKEKLSVAVVHEDREEGNIEQFPEAELTEFRTMSGTSNVAEHQITMKNDKPIKQRYCPKNPKVQGEINTKVDELLEMGFIEHSKSPYSSPIVMVKKKTGKCRLCVDFRHIIGKSVKDAYPMPRINYILDQLREARYMSSLDLKDGYWQIPLEEASEKFTAFTVPGKGLFQWRVIGLHSASATFQRALDQVIGPEMSPNAFTYQDDIIVIGRTQREHKDNLREVFRRLKEANLRINPEKCQIVKQELLYLGHRVTSQGIGTDPDKVAAIAQLEPPATVLELRQYLGVASWYRRFVPDFARIVKPLNDQLRKGVKWVWTQDHQQAFEEVEARLNTEDGEKVISYSSRTLNGAEKNYSRTEKECLAIVWAIRKLRPYLEGYHFKVVTDHMALKWLNSPSGRIARWALELQQYDFEVAYRKGQLNVVADALSRQPMPETLRRTKELVPNSECNWIRDMREK